MPEHALGREPQVEAPAPSEAPAGPAAPVSGFAALASRPPAERAAAVGRSAGNAAVARVLLRQAAPASEAPAAEANASQTWQHKDVRPRAEAIEKEQKAKEKPKDRGLELYMELVPAVVRAVKGYSTADGKQVPIENALLIIAQGSAEHSPYNPETLDHPVIPAGNMMWGVTTDTKDESKKVRTTTDEVKGGQRVTEKNRSFRAYDSPEEAAVGYLRALEGTDPDAARNPNYKKVLDVLTKPGATPADFGKVLDDVNYATAPDYGEKVAANAGTSSWASAKSLIKRFAPQIKAGQTDKIDALRDKQAAYADLIDWIENRAGEVQAELDSTVVSSERAVELEEELRQLEADRDTAMAALEKIEPLVEKEVKMLADLDEFFATLEPTAP